MPDPKYTYLLLMLGTLLFPFLLSFDRKVHFYRRWRFLAPSILIPAVIFIIWDVAFTKRGIWHFNDAFTLGLDIFSLPIEEWLFFLFVPYACVFVYDVVKYYFPGINDQTAGRWISYLLLITGVSLILWRYDNAYTVTTFVILILTLTAQFTLPGSAEYLFRFYVAYLICLIPFALVNGILTSLPVVSYNDLENIGFRIYTIPLEDLFYFMILFLMNVSIYEYLLKRSAKKGKNVEQ